MIRSSIAVNPFRFLDERAMHISIEIGKTPWKFLIFVIHGIRIREKSGLRPVLFFFNFLPKRFDSGRINSYLSCQYLIRCSFRVGFLRSSFAEIKRRVSSQQTGNTSSSLAWIPAGTSGISATSWLACSDMLYTYHTLYVGTRVRTVVGRDIAWS